VKTLSYLDVPDRMQELWPWVCAFCAYDYGDAMEVAKLIRESESIPDEFKCAVADVVSGLRKPNLRAAAKVKIPPSEMMKIAGSISVPLGLCDAFKYRGVNEIAERLKKEPIDLVRELENDARKILLDAADELGVHVETIENLLREMRRRVNAWPVV
jgi:hypothetical protein